MSSRVAEVMKLQPNVGLLRWRVDKEKLQIIAKETEAQCLCLQASISYKEFANKMIKVAWETIEKHATRRRTKKTPWFDTKVKDKIKK